jgi:transposase-like protein
MAQRVGRKPLSTGHVKRLYGSPRAKERMRVFLETLEGKLTVPEGCRLLSLSESQFHDARHRWLQRALEQLEPRPLGRPPDPHQAAQDARERTRLQAEVARLEEQLRAAQAREEIAQIVAHPAGVPGKKTDDPWSMPRRPR